MIHTLFKYVTAWELQLNLYSSQHLKDGEMELVFFILTQGLIQKSSLEFTNFQQVPPSQFVLHKPYLQISVIPTVPHVKPDKEKRSKSTKVKRGRKLIRIKQLRVRIGYGTSFVSQSSGSEHRQAECLLSIMWTTRGEICRGKVRSREQESQQF